MPSSAEILAKYGLNSSTPRRSSDVLAKYGLLNQEEIEQADYAKTKAAPFVGPPKELAGPASLADVARASLGNLGSTLKSGLEQTALRAIPAAFDDANQPITSLPLDPTSLPRQFVTRGLSSLFGDQAEGLRSTANERLTEDIPGLVSQEEEMARLQASRGNDFLGETVQDVIGSGTSALPLAGAAITGAVTRNPAAAAGAARLLAPIPAVQAKAQALLEAKRAGMSDAEAEEYSNRVAGVELATEMFMPGAGKTIAGTITKRVLGEQFSEQAATLGETGVQVATAPELAPKSVDEALERQRRTIAPALLFGGVTAPIGAKAVTEGPRQPVLPDTGDPAVDEGKNVAVEIQKAVDSGSTTPPSVSSQEALQAPPVPTLKPRIRVMPDGSLRAAESVLEGVKTPTELPTSQPPVDPLAPAPEEAVQSARQRTQQLEQNIKAQESQQRVLDELSGSKDRKVGGAVAKMFNEGKFQFYGNQKTLPEGADSATDKGYFDGKTLYLNEANLGKGEAGSVALHEIKHFMDKQAKANGEVVRERSIRRILGDEGNTRVNDTIRKLATSGNKIAQESLADAVAGATVDGVVDEAILNDEIGAYFLQRAQAARESKTSLGRAGVVLKDMLSYAKAKMADFGLDWALSENDLLYLGRNLATKAASLSNADLKVGDGRAMLVGPKAATFQKYLDEGVVFEGALDLLPRSETDDSKMRIRKPLYDKLAEKGGKIGLGFVMEHPELYVAYPELKTLSVEVMGPQEAATKSALGYADGENNRIVLNPKIFEKGEKDFRRLIAHEVQHIVQRKEGFVGGSTWTEFMDEQDALDYFKTEAEVKGFDKTVSKDIAQELNSSLNTPLEANASPTAVIKAAIAQDPTLQSYLPEERQLIERYQEIQKRFSPLQMKKEVAFDKYVKTAGELEARTVENRLDLTKGERQETPFYESTKRMPFGATKEQMVDNSKPESGSRFAEGRAESRKQALSENEPKKGRASKARSAQDKRVEKIAGQPQQDTERKAPKATAARNLTTDIGASAAAKATNRLKDKFNPTARAAWDGIFSPTQGKQADVTEAQETARGAANVATIKAEQAATRLNRSISAYVKKVKGANKATVKGSIDRLIQGASSKDEATRTAARTELQTKYPLVAAEVTKTRLAIQRMGLEIRKSILESGKRLTNDDLRNVKAIEANLETYLTRAYRADMKGLIQKDWIKKTKKAWEKETKGGAKPATEGAQRFENAKQFLKNQLSIGSFEELTGAPEDFDPVQIDRLRALHEAWVPRTATSANLPVEPTMEQQAAYVDAVIKDLKTARDAAIKAGTYDARLEQKAIDLAGELLEKTKKGGSAFAEFYRGARLNKTVVTERNQVPEPIRKLWGEIEEVNVALAMTLLRQGKYIADAKMLDELYDTGMDKYFTDPAKAEGTRFTEKLAGPTLGPLEGMMATPEFKAAVDSHVFQKASLEALFDALSKGAVSAGAEAAVGTVAGILSGLAGRVKKYAVIYNPEQYFNNVVGSFVTPVMSGFLPGAGLLRGTKAALGTIAPTARKSLGKEAERMLSLNMQESGQVGEIQNALKELMTLELVEGAKGSRRRKIDAAITDTFAASDNAGRFGTLYAWADFYEKYHKARGDNFTEEQIFRKAAETTKRRSVTFSRVPAAAKAVERSGASMFLPFFLETYRVVGYSMVDSISMVAQGRAEGGKAGAMKVTQGLRGFAGATAAMVFNKAVVQALVRATAVVAIATGFAPDAPEEDEEKLKTIQQGMADRFQGKTLHLLEITPEGRYVFLEGERMAMLDTVFGPMQKLAEGDTEGAWKDVKGLLFPNAVLVRAFQTIADDKARAPTMEGELPETYKEFENLLQENAGLTPDTTARISRITELFLPSALKSSMSASFGERDLGPEVNALMGLGVKTAIFDPVRALKSDARSEYADIVETARTTFKDVASATNPSDATIRTRYQEALVDEFKAFQRLTEIVDAVRATGMKQGEMAALLEEAGLTKPQRQAALTGTYRPSIVTERVLNGTRDAETTVAVKKAKTTEEKLAARQAIQDKYSRIRRIVIELNQANNLEALKED